MFKFYVSEKTRTFFLKKDIFVCSSGGTNLIKMLGSISVLQSNNLLPDFKYLSGTSAGSFICFMICLNMNVSDTFFKMANDDDLYVNGYFLAVNLNLSSFYNFFFKSYLTDNTENKRNLYVYTLREKYGLSDISFEQLYRLTKKELIITVANYDTAEVSYLSYKNSPKMSVITALDISSNVSPIWKPIEYNGVRYMDGGLARSFPIDIFLKDCSNYVYDKNIKFSPERLLGIKSPEFGPGKISADKFFITSFLDTGIRLLGSQNTNLKSDLIEQIMIIEFDKDLRIYRGLDRNMIVRAFLSGVSETIQYMTEYDKNNLRFLHN